MLGRFLICTLMIVACAAKTEAQTWKLVPGTQQKLYRLGLHGYGRIEKDNVMKSETPANQRQVLAPNTANAWGTFNSLAHREINMIRPVSWGGAQAAVNSKVRADWTHWASNTVATNPVIKLSYDLNNMSEAEGTVAITTAKARSFAAGYIERQISKVNALNNTTYLCGAEINFDGDYSSDIILGADGSTVLPVQQSTMIAKFGLSTVTAVWDALLENPGDETLPVGGWIITREVWDPALNQVVTQSPIEVHGYELDYTLTVYTKVTGSETLTYSCQVGPTNHPVQDPFNGSSGVIHIQSDSYTVGTTGTEPAYNDHWTGSVEVIPNTTILHTP